MKALARRVLKLEAIIKAKRRGSALKQEIGVMTNLERQSLRDFLLHIKNGGCTDRMEYEKLRINAEAAILQARSRLV